MIPPNTVLPMPPVPPTQRLDAYQAAGREGGGIGQAFNAAMDGFSARSAQMNARVGDVAVSGAVPPAVAAEAALTPPVPQTGAVEVRGGAPGPMALIVDCFNFAIEASLVSRAATQFTGSVSTLMKGQ